ncbi:ABC transporter ATP-binding protein [Corynebacterium sp. H113]|uniref:ABC transporter ATP-binding protein n=1 Tax=Corynebacterium sp. H113 TaxID=3133419 RepID=UPI00309ECA9E
MTIQAQAVRRSFGTNVAVAHADLDIREGTVTGLIGPNGCGKTTLLLMLAGLLAPDIGSIRIAGVNPVTHGHAARAKIGWMPDHVGTWESLTATEILVTFGELYGIPENQGFGIAHQLLEEVGLSEFADRKVRVLSRGQKQRLSLARALVHDPEVLLLDEPASGMDPESRLTLREIIRRRAQQGTTVVISSHILPELEAMVDDVVMMQDGRTIAQESSGTSPVWRIVSRDSELLLEWATANGLARPRPVTDSSVTGGSEVEFTAPETEASRYLSSALQAGVTVVQFGSRSLESRYLNMTTQKDA